MSRITDDNNELAKQAPQATYEYLRCGIRDIDDLLDEGYAKDHPELLAAYMKTAAMDLFTAVISREINKGLNGIAEAITDANDVQRIIHDIYSGQTPKNFA
jgi:hypothetical protein